MKKLILTFTGILLIITILSGCTSPHNNLGFNTNAENNDKVSVSDAFPNELKTEKINSIILNNHYTIEKGGIIYTNSDNMYGIMSLDGKSDTGAIYTYCEAEGIYFAVSKNIIDEDKPLNELNYFGIVDVTGKELVPYEYCSFEVLSNKYIKAIKATEMTDTESDALVFSTDKMFTTLLPSDGDTLYKGIWYIYDILESKIVPEVTGTKPYAMSARGNFIIYTNDNEKQIIVNDNGEKLSDNACLFDNGSYAIDNKDKGTVYDTNANKLFEYDSHRYQVSYTSGDYYVVREYNEQTQEFIYSVFDKKGTELSVDFDDLIFLYGEFIECNDKLYDFDGNQVVDGEFNSVYSDNFTQNAFMLKNDDEVIVVTSEGKVIYNQPNNEDINFDSAYFISNKRINDERYCYSFKDSDFKIKGNSIGYWIVKNENENNGKYDIIDVISGDAIVTNYNSYKCSKSENNSYYLYAENENGAVDIYLISI